MESTFPNHLVFYHYLLFTDCNKFCDFGGELDGKCQLCMCRGDAPVVGRAMLAHTPFPAVGVRVFAVGKDDEPVAVSNSSGYFEVRMFNIIVK